MTNEDHQKILYGQHYNGLDQPLVDMPTIRISDGKTSVTFTEVAGRFTVFEPVRRGAFLVCPECCYMFEQHNDELICSDC